jgi:hypothetical protein
MILLDMPLAKTGGGMIFLAFVILFFVVTAFLLYTRKGSGIEQRPGKKGPSTMKGDEGEGGTFGGAGTR